MPDINKTGAEVAAILLSVGDVSELETAAKETVVSAINELDGKRFPQTKYISLSLPLTGWDGAITQEVSIPEISASDTAQMVAVEPTQADADKWLECFVTVDSWSSGKIKFRAITTPLETLHFTVTITQTTQHDFV